jgi:hypothetical protein
MKTAGKFVTGLVLASGLSTLTAIAMAAGPAAYFQQYREPEGIRGLIDRTQSDLRAAEDVVDPKNSKDRERYRNAQKNLSDLDRHFTKGKYDKGELDRSIGDIQSILDHNTLQASSRDALLRDIEDLRVARARLGH